ncbi:Tricarboxylate transport transcriptional regulator TctD (fragment) [Nostocoides australiense Ben110]|uniref:Tricarboxylate transport transcriptional regulator TctD n=1 Tax=Nostocoides australiense Ben110 TaxID=1193182 RepID=W6JU50_9MICO
MRRPAGVGPDVLMLSAARDIETLRVAQQAGAFHYLIKPFDIHALRLRLSEYAVFRSQVDAVTEAHQDDVDRLFRPGQVRIGKEPPKGISNETIDLVVKALRDVAEDISAQECAEAVGLSRSSARRYLEHLVDSGRAQVRHRYGATGRPDRRYSPL